MSNALEARLRHLKLPVYIKLEVSSFDKILMNLRLEKHSKRVAFQTLKIKMSFLLNVQTVISC
jgi:hypothetical protein